MSEHLLYGAVGLVAGCAAGWMWGWLVNRARRARTARAEAMEADAITDQLRAIRAKMAGLIDTPPDQAHNGCVQEDAQ